MNKVATIFTAIVNYSLTLAEMIKRGKFITYPGGISIKRFPVTGEGRKKIRFELLPFHGFLKEMEKRSLRSARIEELLAFGVKYKKLIREQELVIVAEGSCDDSFPQDVVEHVVIGGTAVPCLRGDKLGNHLDTIYADEYGNEKYRSLAVHKD